jgi:phosphonate transport system substrate-binding protein
MKHPNRIPYSKLVVLTVLALIMSACAAATPTAAPTTVPPTAGAGATATAIPPTPVPPVCEKMANPPTVAAGALGSPDNPIVLAFVPSGDTGKITKGGNQIADCLGQMTGLAFKVAVGTSYAATIEAMGANKAQVGFLNTFSVLMAEAKYGVVPVLAVLRKYNTNAIDPDKAMGGQLTPFYKGQFITRADSGIKTFADLKGKTFCFVDPASTSGYIVPRIILKANGVDPDVDFKATQNAGSHNNVAIAVYKGDCDAGVTFIDVLTDAAANLKDKYPDIATKVVAFADTDQIPNDGVQFVKDLDPKVGAAITDGLMFMAKDPGGNNILKSIYTINDFQKIDSSFYDAFSKVLVKAGVDPATYYK